MAPSSKTEKKRCLYEVLELSRSCTTEEIRSAYRRLALQRHPDKLCRTGVPVAEATAGFQELLNAYEVLSDPKERLWYDTHLKQNLFSSKFAASHSSGSVPDLFSFFSNSAYFGYSDSGRGFYKVYADLFEKIYASELSFAKKSGLPLPDEPPAMGNLESPYEQVTAFYNHWLKFMTVLDFSFVDQCDPMAATNRKAMKRMDEENKKARKKARREYSESVRGLANFVKKRDKRVIDMQFKRNAEMERKREEEKQRKKELQRERAERARNYEEPEWAQVEEEEGEEDEEDEDFVTVEEERRELYCVVCCKKFKSDKQWRNHEQSKKHKEKVAELREAFSEEDKEYEASTTQQNNGEAGDDDEIVEDFEDNVGIQDNDIDDGKTESSKTNEFDNNNNNNNGGEESDDAADDDDDADDDDEASILEAMLSGHKSRKNRHKSEVQVDIDSDELEFMEFNDTNGPRRNRGGRRRRSRRQEEGKEIKEEKEDLKEEKEDLKEEEKEEVKVEVNEEAAGDSIKVEMKERNDGETVKPRSRPVPGSKSKKPDKATERHHKHSQKPANKKSTTKKESAPNPKDAESKGRKQKMAGNDFANTCDKCGEQFKSRTKLHQHLGDTGHASLKSR